MDVDTVLTRLETLVRDARSMPMSTSCVLNRDQVLDLVEAVRRSLPDQLAEAQRVMGARDAVVAEGRDQAKAVLDQAYAERTRLVSQDEVHRQAEIEAERILHEADLETQRMRAEIDDYVDAKLANFEIVLHDTLGAVARGRDRIHGRRSADALGAGSGGEPVPGVGPEGD